MSDLHALWLDERHWRLFYAFYVCKQDPRLVVPRPNPSGQPVPWLGATWNLAHTGAFGLMAVFAALTIGPAWWVGAHGGGIAGAVIVFMIALGAVWAWAWKLATRGL